MENNAITVDHLELGPRINYVLSFPILPSVIENESLMSDVIASPKESLISMLLHLPFFRMLVKMIALHLILLHHQF